MQSNVKIQCVVMAAVLWYVCRGCTTIAVGKSATVDGSVMATHSNDGDGDAVGNIKKIDSADWPAGSQRKVQGGYIPQVRHTYAYITEGYPAMNEFQVGLAESTCNSVLSGGPGALVNIVDLSGIALERSVSSRKAILVMGEIAEKYGYNDNGESLLVTDPSEAFIFHVMPDSTKQRAIWVAQRIPDDHVAVVTNAFTIRNVNLSDSQNFMYSSNIVSEARLLGWNSNTSDGLDFTRIFSGPELGHKYASGRRMWMIYKILGNSPNLSPFYDEFVSSAPYPATIQVRQKSSQKNPTEFEPDLIDKFDLIACMRNQYKGTPFSMTKSEFQNSGGPFGTSDRWVQGPTNVTGNWERTIAIFKTIVSYVVISRNWLPREIGGLIWVSLHAAHTSCYIPFPVGIPAKFIPPAFTENQFGVISRGKSFWHASRFVFNFVQIHFDLMIEYVKKYQMTLEGNSTKIQQFAEKIYQKNHNITEVSQVFLENSNFVVSTWWNLSDELYLNFADGFCNSCGTKQHRSTKKGSQQENSRIVGYPDWWLKTSGYTMGPPPSPPVPPLQN